SAAAHLATQRPKVLTRLPILPAAARLLVLRVQNRHRLPGRVTRPQNAIDLPVITETLLGKRREFLRDRKLSVRQHRRGEPIVLVQNRRVKLREPVLVRVPVGTRGNSQATRGTRHGAERYRSQSAADGPDSHDRGPVARSPPAALLELGAVRRLSKRSESPGSNRRPVACHETQGRSRHLAKARNCWHIRSLTEPERAPPCELM